MSNSVPQSNQNAPKQTPMTKEAVARIQSAEAKVSDGKVAAGEFAARAQSAAAKNDARAQPPKQ